MSATLNWQESRRALHGWLSRSGIQRTARQWPMQATWRASRRRLMARRCWAWQNGGGGSQGHGRVALNDLARRVVNGCCVGRAGDGADFHVKTTGAVAPRESRAKLGDFVPTGWSLEQQELADLNSDGSMDALLLLRQQRTGAPLARAVALVLRERGSVSYVLSEVNGQLIPRSDNPPEDETEEMEFIVRRGGFDLKIALATARDRMKWLRYDIDSGTREAAFDSSGMTAWRRIAPQWRRGT